MHKIIQIHPCLLKLSHKQESVTDRQPLLLYPSPLSRGDTNLLNENEFRYQDEQTDKCKVYYPKHLEKEAYNF